MPIVWSWESDESKSLNIHKLRDVLGVKKEDLPGLFVYNSNTNTIVRYPETLDNAKAISAELVMMWGKKEVMDAEIGVLQKRLDDRTDDAVEADKKLTEEEATKIESHFEHMKPEAEKMGDAIIELKKLLAENNPFAERVAEGHHGKARDAHIKKKEAMKAEKKVEEPVKEEKKEPEADIKKVEEDVEYIEL